MNCPLENTETADILLDYCSRTLDANRTLVLERHIELCPACREFAEHQRAVWSALDAWDAPPVSSDFDARLYARIGTERSWRDRVAAIFRPVLVYRGVPAMAALCLVVTAGILLDRAGKPVAPSVSPEVPNVEVRAEQVEKALDAIEVLSEFNNKVRPEKTESKL